MHHDARAQRAASRLPDSFSYLIIIAATLSSSSTLLEQPLEGVSRGGGFSLDVRRKNREKWSAGKQRAAKMVRKPSARCELCVARKQFSK